jgi:hypothetical protein
VVILNSGGVWTKIISTPAPANDSFIGLAHQCKDIVFKFMVEYSSLWDFGPYVVTIIGLFLYEDFLKMIFWLVSKPKIRHKVIIP